MKYVATLLIFVSFLRTFLIFEYSLANLSESTYPYNISQSFEIESKTNITVDVLHTKYKVSKSKYQDKNITYEYISLIIHPAINDSNTFLQENFCKFHILDHDFCQSFHANALPDLESLQHIDLHILSPTNEFETFKLTWNYYNENIDTKLNEFCDWFNPVFYQFCYDELEAAFLSNYLLLMSHYEQSSNLLLQKSNIWGNIRDNVTVVNPREYLIPVYKFLSSHSNIVLNRSIEEVLLSTNNLTNFSLEGDMFINLSVDTKSEVSNEPSLHVVIATTTKMQLFGMIASLQELTVNDYLTIIFDGTNNSETPSLQTEIRKYASMLLKCHLNFIHEDVALGYWGQVAKNKYNNLPGDYDFVIHADDDDLFTPNAFPTVKKVCNDKNTLYLFQMVPLRNKKHIQPIWSHKNILTYRNVGSPNGVIPKAANQYGKWGQTYDGDAAFYLSLVPYVRHIEYIDFITYKYITDND